MTGNNFVQAINAGSTTDPQNPNPHPSNPIDGAADIVNIPAVTIEACDPESSCPPLLKQIDFSGFPANSNIPIAIHEEFIVGQGSPEWWDWHERITNILSGDRWVFTGSAAIMKVAPGAPCDVGTSTIFDLDPGLEIWFDFEGNIGGLNFGDKLCVWKDVIWVSPVDKQFTGILEIEQWPTIHKKMAVGGEMFPVDTTALLLAATYSTASWMIPLMIAAVGFGIIITHQKTKLKYNSCPSCKLETEDFFELGDKVVSKCDNPKCRVNLFFIRRYRNSFK